MDVVGLSKIWFGVNCGLRNEVLAMKILAVYCVIGN